MGVLRAKVVSLATLATVAMLAACAPAAEDGTSTATPPSTASPAAEASTTPSPSLSVDPTENPEPTRTLEPQLTDDPAVAGDGDGDYYEEQPTGPSTWTYRYAPTDGYPTYFPEVLPPSNDDGTVGSGCNPPDSGTLPDGIWRVLMVNKSYQEWPAWIEFDLTCSYSFEYPDAPERGNATEYVRGDWSYIVTNDDPATRTLPIAEDAIGYGTNWGDWPPRAWEDTWIGCGPCDTWIWVNDGEVTELAWPYDWPTDWRYGKYGTLQTLPPGAYTS